MGFYLPARTRLIHATESVALVRGSIPLLEDGKSALSQIRQDLHLVDTPIHLISLIDNQGELPMLSAELRAAGIPLDALPSTWPPFSTGYSPVAIRGAYASLTWWPVEAYGVGTATDVVTGQFLTDRGIQGQPGGYNLDGLVDYLTVLMLQKSDRKLIVYVHCSLGADRTGAVTFGYLSKALAVLPAAALKITESVTSPNSDYIRLIDAYTAFLNPAERT